MDGCQELADLELQPAAFVGEGLRGREHLGGGRAGLGGAVLHLGDVRGDAMGPFGGLLHVAGDFLGRSPLLFDGRRNRCGYLREPPDGAGDFPDAG